MVSAARRMEEMTASLVDPPLRRIELLEPMKRIVQAYGAQRQANDPDIVLQASANPVVNAADDVLETVIENLLDNAISFSPPGGEVTLSLDADAAGAIITVEDQGPGVPDDKLDRIFDRYYTDRDPADAAPGGIENAHFGIGLWIARRHNLRHIQPSESVCQFRLPQQW